MPCVCLGTTPVDIPTLTVFPPCPDKKNRAAVVVCPGGGYGRPCSARRQTHCRVAEFLRCHVVCPEIPARAAISPPGHDGGRESRCFVLFEHGPRNGALIQIGSASSVSRAGGHLASTAVTHFDDGFSDASWIRSNGRKLAIRIWAAPIYPVITTTDPYTHHRSRKNLLGPGPSEELIDLMSNEKQVTDKTPPCFLVHSSTDTVVPVQNRVTRVHAMQPIMPVELRVFDHDSLWIGLGGNDSEICQWPGLCEKWHGHSRAALYREKGPVGGFAKEMRSSGPRPAAHTNPLADNSTDSAAVASVRRLDSLTR